MSKNILTAIDIDSNQKSIDKQIEENIIVFNKGRLRKKLKDVRDKLKVEFPDDVEKQLLSKETIKSITTELINDDEANKFRLNQKEIISSTKDNHYILRQAIQDLNELNEFSAEMERNEIQKIDHFLSYHEVLYHSLNKINLFQNIIKIRRNSITEYIKSYVNKKLLFNTDSLNILLNIREIYKIDKTIDDIDLYEKFEMESNIDMSDKLADICFQKVSNNNLSNNIINDFYQKMNVVTRLVKTQIISNKLLGLLLSNKFISNNYVTCFKNMYSNNINNQNIYCTRTLGELLFEITNEENKSIDKQFKQQIYMCYDGTRPTADEYYKWNGLQVFDIDLKEWTGSIDLLKQKIFDYLQEFSWFLWVCKSASGKGIHIYSKVTPPHHIYTDIKNNNYISKYWFKVNYQTKVSIVYDILYRLNADNRSNINFPKNFFSEESNYFELTNKIFVDGEPKLVGVDNTVGRITSGIRLTYDEFPLINHDFVDLHVGLNLAQTLDGFNYKETIERVLLRDTPVARKHINIIDNDLAIETVEGMNDNKPIEIDLSKFISLGVDIADVKSLPRSSINYQLRYNICNTLAAVFGKDGLSIAHTILDSEGCKNVAEINSFYSCAISNGKNPSKYGLDVLKKCGIIKSIELELKEVVDSNFKNGIRKAINNALKNKLSKSKIELGNNEFISDKKDIILNPFTGGITNDKINMIFSPPGTGKTEFIKTLAKQGKRILLVLPYISVIKNKIETDPEVMELFECFYGGKDIKTIEYGINAVTTFDKFARANYEKLSKMFDYIFIDESHLLFTSAYRIEATSNVIKKIKELFFISSNDPFSAKLCLLTGTETGESYFFGTVANIIRINKKSLNKTMEFLICDDILDATTRLANKIWMLINEGYKILIPTNKGEIYSEKIIGMAEYLLQRPIKYGYYKRSNTEQEICRLINDNNTVGDYEIIFCSNYLSVGVDINDGGKHQEDVKFASIYLGPFSGYEVEQFNARVRKSGIRSIYCIQTEKSDGTTNDLLLEEPNLLLRITQEDKDNFIDDKAIASAKQEFLAQYDPVLHKITTPGFSYVNGKIRFNLEEYELTSFETKYNECMQHPVKVARELDKYGYIITVSDEFNGLEEIQQEELKKIGIAAAKEEKIKKHSLLVGTFCELIQKNTYINNNGLEFSDIIGWIGKHSDIIFENRNLEEYIKIEFDIFATPVSVEVKSKEALDAMYKPAKYLISKYSVTKALDIINLYVDDTGILKQKNFKRAINLLKLVDSSDANELALPMTKILEKMYDFVDEFEISKDFKIGYNTYQSTIESWTNTYIDMLGISINTQYAFQKVEDGITEMLADIATKSTGKNGMRFVYNKMPDQDSSNVMNRRSVDSMIERMFQITSETIKTNKTARQKHIVLQTQNF